MTPKIKVPDNKIETVRSRLTDSIEIASFYRHHYKVGRTDLTRGHHILQFAAIGYTKGHQVDAHLHNPLPRQTIGTSECWVVIKGKVKVNLFDTDNKFLFTIILRKGDAAIFYSGGHSLEVISRKVQIYELKNGPYEGDILDKKQI